MSVVDTPTGAAMKCDCCGRFFQYAEPGSSWVFVPSSDAPSYEESIEWCRACTEKHGRPLPRQSVRIDMCSGVYGAPALSEATGIPAMDLVVTCALCGEEADPSSHDCTSDGDPCPMGPHYSDRWPCEACGWVPDPRTPTDSKSEPWHGTERRDGERRTKPGGRGRRSTDKGRERG